MPTCRFGWWRSTTPMWTSTPCGPGPRSRARAWRASIASVAARPQVLGQNGPGIQRGRKGHGGSARRANRKVELPARCHASQAFNVKAEVRSLAPRNDLPVRIHPKSRRIDERQRQRPIIENQGERSRGANITRLQVSSGGNVHPQSIAQGAAAVPFDRAQIGEAHVLAGDEYRVLRARHEFDRLFERTHGHAGAVVQDLHRLEFGLAGAAGPASTRGGKTTVINGRRICLKYTGT